MHVLRKMAKIAGWTATIVFIGATGASAAAVVRPQFQVSSAPYYRCVEQSTNKEPVPPLPSQAAAERERVGSPPPLCSGGQVAEPIDPDRDKGVPRVQVREAPEASGRRFSLAGNPVAPPTLSGIEEEASYPCQYYSSAGAYYCHSFERRAFSSKRTIGFGANLIVDDPPEEPAGDDPSEHSLTQLWAVDTNNNSDVEFGYGANPAAFGGVYSHLFVSYSDGGAYPYPYNPPYPFWIGNSESPYAPDNIVSEPGQLSEAFFAVERYPNGSGGYNWWFYINGYWMGHMTEANFNHGFPLSDNELYVGGEVASASKSEPCIWMGTGATGQESGSANVNHASYVWTEGTTEGTSYLYPTSYFEEGYPNYKEGETEPHTGTVHYGGKGWSNPDCP